jgi:alpha-amylase
LKAKQNEAKDAGDATTAEQLAEMLEDWRRLTTSDHFYYMGTKYFADGAAHRYFSPYDSPYDSYVNFMNVLDNLRTRLSGVSVKS